MAEGGKGAEELTTDWARNVLQQAAKDVDSHFSSKLVASLSLRSVTPWWGGDYEGRTSSCVDEDEVVGRLRWLLRTVYNRFAASNTSNYSEAEDFVSKILGSEEGRSLYAFRTSCGSVSRWPGIELMRKKGK